MPLQSTGLSAARQNYLRQQCLDNDIILKHDSAERLSGKVLGSPKSLLRSSASLPGSHSLPQPVVVREEISNRHYSSMRSNSSTATDVEKTLLMMPPKGSNRILRHLRWSIFSVYRRLNLLVLLPNLVALLILCLRHNHNIMELSSQETATAVAVNVIIAVLIRQELVINLLFAICGTCPQSMPLRFRRLVAKIYHLGGVHSGAAIAATMWFAACNASLAREWSDGRIAREPILFAVTGIIDTLLIGIIVLAHPSLRAKFHNTFEMVHRFFGWTAVALFWVHMFVSTIAERKVQDSNIPWSHALQRSPVFWSLLVVTVSLILPWLRLRKIEVHAEPISDHVIRLHFAYTTLALCAAPRISDNPLKEWHSFAGIPEESGNGYSLLVSKAGDWTTNLIKSPPAKIWIRGIPTRGVLHIAPIFKRLILVATGSGIGPILSLTLARELDCRILWSTRDPERTYKRNIIDHVYQADPRAVIVNTTVFGYPNLVQEAYNLYVMSHAEAVFVISNAKITRKVVYGLESRGIPTYGPIFDS